MFILRSLLRVIYVTLCTVIVLAGTVVLTVIVIDKGGELYDTWKQKPIIIQQEVINRPTTLESEMAQMLGWFQLRLNQATVHVRDSSREIQRLETRVDTLEKYISENELPVPAEPVNVNLLIR